MVSLSLFTSQAEALALEDAQKGSVAAVHLWPRELPLLRVSPRLPTCAGQPGVTAEGLTMLSGLVGPKLERYFFPEGPAITVPCGGALNVKANVFLMFLSSQKKTLKWKPADASEAARLPHHRRHRCGRLGCGWGCRGAQPQICVNATVWQSWMARSARHHGVGWNAGQAGDLIICGPHSVAASPYLPTSMTTDTALYIYFPGRAGHIKQKHRDHSLVVGGFPRVPAAQSPEPGPGWTSRQDQASPHAGLSLASGAAHPLELRLFLLN